MRYDKYSFYFKTTFQILFFCGSAGVVGVAIGYWGSNPGGSEIFCTCPDMSWDPPSLLYNGYRVFSGVKTGRGMAMTPHPFRVPSSWKDRAIHLLPLWAVRSVQSLSASTECTLPYLCYRILFVMPQRVSFSQTHKNSLKMLSHFQFSEPRYYFCTYVLFHKISAAVKIQNTWLLLVSYETKGERKTVSSFFHRLTFEHPVYNIANFLGQDVKTKIIILFILLYCLRGAIFYNNLRRIAIHYNFRG